MKHIAKLLHSKAFYIVTGLLLQIIILLAVIYYLSESFVPIYILLLVISVVVCINLVGKEIPPSSRLMWTFVILSMPVFGGLIYLLFGEHKIPEALMIKDRQAWSDYKEYALQNIQTLTDVPDDVVLDKMVSMAWHNGYFPVYENCQIRYFPSGEEQVQAIIQAMSQARDFIFVETFILNAGRMWEAILKVMIEKAREGVDVRMIYDDFGAITHMDPHYVQYLESQGIKAQVFNPLKPKLAIRMNNRDHRKIIVVDCNTEFTGGINISDEYVNIKKRFGYWKDMGVEITGRAVEMFTISFLQIWNYQASANDRYEKFIPHPDTFLSMKEDGYVIPFSDSPTDDKLTGKQMHMNLFNLAKDYVWISTPYLILDAEMISTIKLACANGVDVRIVVPGIPDKKMVYSVTQANFETLLRAGARIYIYEPGFIHGKVCVTDDESALVGTVNMDSLSYYVNYECGIWLHQTACIPAIKKDFEEIFKVSREVKLEDCEKVSFPVKFYRNTLKIFSPML